MKIKSDVKRKKRILQKKAGEKLYKAMQKSKIIAKKHKAKTYNAIHAKRK